tara:strand:+ start:359 stop:634 length:276 start_codon:yes stop_codon:yes gene_type:complete
MVSTDTLAPASVRIPGGVGERLKPPDCKSGLRKEFVGSNPTPSTNLTTGELISGELISGYTGPDSSAVEHVLGKNGVGGSIPPLGSIVLPN